MVTWNKHCNIISQVLWPENIGLLQRPHGGLHGGQSVHLPHRSAFLRSQWRAGRGESGSRSSVHYRLALFPLSPPRDAFRQPLGPQRWLLLRPPQAGSLCLFGLHHRVFSPCLCQSSHQQAGGPSEDFRRGLLRLMSPARVNVCMGVTPARK